VLKEWTSSYFDRVALIFHWCLGSGLYWIALPLRSLCH